MNFTELVNKCVQNFGLDVCAAKAKVSESVMTKWMNGALPHKTAEARFGKRLLSLFEQNAKNNTAVPKID